MNSWLWPAKLKVAQFWYILTSKCAVAYVLSVRVLSTTSVTNIAICTVRRITYKYKKSWSPLLN